MDTHILDWAMGNRTFKMHFPIGEAIDLRTGDSYPYHIGARILNNARAISHFANLKKEDKKMKDEMRSERRKS